MEYQGEIVKTYTTVFANEHGLKLNFIVITQIIMPEHLCEQLRINARFENAR